MTSQKDMYINPHGAPCSYYSLILSTEQGKQESTKQLQIVKDPVLQQEQLHNCKCVVYQLNAQLKI